MNPIPFCATPQFCQTLHTAVDALTERLRDRYEQAFPGQEPQVREVLAQAQAEAWQTSFPHLFLPDLAEARLARLAA